MKKLVFILGFLCLNYIGFAQYESVKNKNKKGGYAGLNSLGRIDTNQLPKLGVVSFNAITNKPTTLSGYGISDGLTSSSDLNFYRLTNRPTTMVGYGISDGLSSSSNLNWTNVVNKPTTLSGYGISDGVATSGSYTNPSWLISIPYSKITSPPATANLQLAEPLTGLYWKKGGYWNISETVKSKWQDVCFGGDKFVAVGDSGTHRIMYSFDGEYWLAITPPSNMANANFTSICYGNGMFIAVASSNSSGTNQQIMTSTDGITWTERNTSDLFAFKDVCFGAGKYIIVGATTSPNTKILTSVDGITWTATTLSGNTFSYIAIAYGGGRFVAVADVYTNKDAVLESLDFGASWQIKRVTDAANLGDNFPYTGICYSNGAFRAVSTSTQYSRTWMTWIYLVPSSNNYYRGDIFQFPNSSIAYGDGMNVYINPNAKPYLISSKAEPIWSNVQSSISMEQVAWSNTAAYNVAWKSVCYANGMFVAVANGGINTEPRVMTSGAFFN